MPGTISNFFMRTMVESPLRGILGDSFAVITVHGRKSGKPYSTPINVSRDGDGYTVVSMRSRTWWRNLRGGALAELHVAGKQLKVRGEVLETRDQVAPGLCAYFRLHPNHARYFKIQTGADGQVKQEDLERAAGERVVIHLCPVG